MTQNTEEFLHAIDKGLSEAQQGTLFNSQSVSLENACVDYLRHKEYSVRKPLMYPYETKKLNDLISLFYTSLSKYSEKDALVYRNTKQELKLAKSFVESIQKSDGLSKQTAMKRCANIIQIVFNNIERFNFTIPLTFGIFGQQNMSWVTELAIRILNEEINNQKELNVEKKIDEIISRCPKEEMGWSDEVLNTILKRQEEKTYGKKESN
jgi:hypothetical protein